MPIFAPMIVIRHSHSDVGYIPVTELLRLWQCDYAAIIFDYAVINMMRLRLCEYAMAL